MNYATTRSLLRRIALLSVLALAPAALSAAPASDAPQQWSINMKDTDIRDFIGAVANITGDTLIVPAGTLHSLYNDSDAPAEWLIVSPLGMQFMDKDENTLDPPWAR